MQVIEPILFWQRFQKMPLVGISRNIPGDLLMAILPLYSSAGLTNIEITMNSPDAEGIIKAAIRDFGACLNIGAGTVCSMTDLEKALQAGATFIVTPVVNEKVIHTCREASIPIFSGAYTPTEIYKAWCAGSNIVKLFPSSSITVDYIKDMQGPFPQIKLMPTGGIGLNNCKDFLNAGAVGVGMGSQLFVKSLIKEKKWDDLYVHFNLISDQILSKDKVVDQII